MNPRLLRIEDYDYQLPEERISHYPQPRRDQSRLLIYHQGQLSQTSFDEINNTLRKDDVLILNNTRVIPARLFFNKLSGGIVEIFCLEPADLSHQLAMAALGKVKWKCLVGGAKKWKGSEKLIIHILNGNKKAILYAEKVSRDQEYFTIEFSWEPASMLFSEILFLAGQVPLPPYFKREVQDSDIERYQTVFAAPEGSVAAPTAGLHFTPELLDRLSEAGIDQKFLTLHVGAGTFKPVTAEKLEDHDMHAERFSVSKDFLIYLKNNPKKRYVVVGTTSMRSIESLYWLAIKMNSSERKNIDTPSLGQWECYELTQSISTDEALQILIDDCDARNSNELIASTSIMIAPGYSFKFCNGLITNFHLPKSTLLVLVSAFIGKDWKKVYDYALINQFNFLSYGDSSILFPE